MIKFYEEYLVEWWGPALLFCLALTAAEGTRRVLRWGFPTAYSHQTDRDGVVIEMHHFIALFTGLLLFVITLSPLFIIYLTMPVTAVMVISSVLFAFCGVLCGFSLVLAIQDANLIRRMDRKDNQL